MIVPFLICFGPILAWLCLIVLAVCISKAAGLSDEQLEGDYRERQAELRDAQRRDEGFNGRVEMRSHAILVGDLRMPDRRCHR